MNFRYTMGRLSLQLDKKLSPGKCGLFKIFSLLSKREGEKVQSLVQYKDNLIDTNDKGKWVKGICQLNEWHDDLKFPVFISVADNIDDCLTQLNLQV